MHVSAIGTPAASVPARTTTEEQVVAWRNEQGAKVRREGPAYVRGPKGWIKVRDE